MDYEKKYNDALKKAKSIYRDAKEAGCSHIDWLEHIFPELTESEDERTRKELIRQVEKSRHHPADKARWIAYLEKQKEQKPSINIDQLKSLMLQYLQEAANEKDDSSIEADTDKWARKILGYDFEQKPTEWSEEDEKMIKSILYVLESYVSQSESASSPSLIASYPTYYKEIDWLKSLRPQPHWKPSEEQIQTLIKIHGNSDMPTQQILGSLITGLNNLKKHM